MPAQALRRQYIWGVGALLVGCLVPAVQGVRLSIEIYAFILIAIALAAAATFIFSRRRVWVAMSEQGLRGRGAFGRTVVLPWSERVSLLPQPGKGVSGMRYGRVDEDGIPTFSGAIFIPYAILRLPEFGRAVAKYAPPEHPLRALWKNAT